MRIEKRITDASNYGDARNKNDVQYIVLLDLDDSPTPHYHIVDGNAYQLVPDCNMSAAVNGARLSRYGVYHGICTKYNSISVGVNNSLSETDKELCVHLIMTLIQRYNISPDKVIRKKDITGEMTPTEWINDDKWKQDVTDKLNDILNADKQ